MKNIFKILAIGLILLITSCGGSSGGNGDGSGLNNNEGSMSELDAVKVDAPSEILGAEGSTQNVRVVFSTLERGQIQKNLAVEGLNNLPSGWDTESKGFSCYEVTSGSGCALNLVFNPQKPEAGNLTLKYSFENSSGMRLPGKFTINYRSTLSNNVKASLDVPGEIKAKVNTGLAKLNISFVTDKGTAKSLTISDLASKLPSGWSSNITISSQDFSCAIVDNANGCVLNLAFEPKDLKNFGKFILPYTFIDDSNVKRSESIEIAYRATEGNNLNVSTTPVSPIIASVDGSQTVTVNFVSDDGESVSGLKVTNLDQLPSGWGQESQGIVCNSNMSNCQLSLLYAPKGGTSNRQLTLSYEYANSANLPKQDNITIDYSATTGNNVTGSVIPAGRKLVATDKPEVVTLQFNTDNNQSAAELEIDKTSLANDWKFQDEKITGCSVVDNNGSCQVYLVYAPQYPTPADEVMNLRYSYLSNAGTKKYATVPVDYRAINRSAITGVVVDPSPPITVVKGASKVVSISFATNYDTATDLSIENNPLPANWSWDASSPTACSQISSSSTSCVIKLVYSPTESNEKGNLTLYYSYTDNTGAKQNNNSLSFGYNSTNTVNITASSDKNPADAVVLGGTLVKVTFKADSTTQKAQNLDVDLKNLPSSWSMAKGGNEFKCASVDNSGSCELLLDFSPNSTTSNGTLALPFNFINDAGSPESRVFYLPYTVSSENSIKVVTDPVSAEPYPFRFKVSTGGSENINVTFSPTHGVITGFEVTTNLANLSNTYPGWKSIESSLKCNPVTSNSACQLMLNFTPNSSSPESSFVQLNYKYKTNGNKTVSALYDIHYTMTKANNLVISTLPSSPITVFAGESTNIRVDFTSDNSREDIKSVVVNNVWSNGQIKGLSGPTGNFSCVNTLQKPCQLTLNYNPGVSAIDETVELVLQGSYKNNKDETNLFTSSKISLNNSKGAYAYVTSADPGNKIYACLIKFDGMLNDCTIYDSTTLGMSYLTGIAKYKGYVYVTSYTDKAILACKVQTDGALGPCNKITNFNHSGFENYGAYGSLSSNLDKARNLVFNNDMLYIANEKGILQCRMKSNLILEDCTEAQFAGNIQFSGLTINNGYLYISSESSIIRSCKINIENGLLGVCNNIVLNGSSSPKYYGLASRGNKVLIGDYQVNSVIQSCTVNSADGKFTNCDSFYPSFGGISAITPILSTDAMYVIDHWNNNIYVCNQNNCTKANGSNSFTRPEGLIIP